MNKNERIAAIKSLTDSQDTIEKKLINYSGQKVFLPVFDIPLEFLIYNPYNGRIKAQTKSLEYINKKKIDSAEREDALLIERFLWESTKYFNQQTELSLQSYGQIEPGIVTADGVIIDGNRRACILNILNRRNNTNHKFRAIILPDELAENEKQIIELETIYQMGIDPKVDYNPIEKYLRLDELKNLNFSDNKISEMLSISTSEINKWKQTFDLMKMYLSRYGYQNLYVSLEKREGHFVDLRNYLNAYRHGIGRDNSDWQFNEPDLHSLVDVYSDYTRIRFPVQNCRIIGNPSKSNGIFCHQKIWKSFLDTHFAILAEQREDPIDEYISHYRHSRSLDEIILIRDEEWSKNVRTDLIENFFNHKRTLEDKMKMVKPVSTLKSAKKTIETINIEEITSNRDTEIDITSDEIITLLEKIKKANFSV